MTRKNHASTSQPLAISKKNASKLVEDKSEKVSNDSKSKKKKKSRNNRKAFLKFREINRQSTNSIQTLNNEVKPYGWKEKREYKKTEIKNEDENGNFEKAAIYQTNKQFYNSFKVQKCDVIDRKSYLFNNRIIERSEKLYSDRSENYKVILCNGCNKHTPKIQNYTQLSKDVQHINYQNSNQLNREISNEEYGEHSRDDKYLYSDGHDQYSSSIFFKPQNNSKVLLDTIIQTIFNRETKGTKSKQCQNIKECIQNYKGPSMIYNHDKNTWDFNGHSGQNTYSICNNTLNNTEYSKSVDSILESLQGNKFEKSLGSEYSDQTITKHQTFNSDVMYINLSSLPDLTFIIEKQKKLQKDKHKDFSKDNTKWISRNNSVNIREFVDEYQNIECKKNNYNDVEIISVSNINNFTTYFDKIWEGVMQEISGY